MCRLVGWVSEHPVTLREVIGAAGVARLRHLSTVHADGWGAAWHDDTGELTVQRSPVRAGADEAFDAFAEGMASRICLVHLRLGTPGYGKGSSSIHPFVDGEWAFAHNGAILPSSAIDALLPPGGHRTPRGVTDSERYFLALRDEMDRCGDSVPQAMDHVLERLQSAGLSAASLNALMIGTDSLHVICWHDPTWQADTIPVWPADILASELAPPYFPLSYRVQPALLSVVSSGIVDDAPDWRPVPNQAVLRIDAATRELTVSEGLTASSAPAPPRQRRHG
jgi:predicted glutamine amidotransferase